MADENKDTGTESDLVKKLRQEIKDRDDRLGAVTEEVAVLKKKDAFSSLGINVESGVGRLLFEKYDGDLDVNSVAETIQEYGIDTSLLGGEAPPAQESAPKTDDTAAHKAMDQASTGAVGSGSTTDDPRAVGMQAYESTMQTTGNPEGAMAAYFGASLEAAAKEATKS